MIPARSAEEPVGRFRRQSSLERSPTVRFGEHVQHHGQFGRPIFQPRRFGSTRSFNCPRTIRTTRFRRWGGGKPARSDIRPDKPRSWPRRSSRATRRPAGRSSPRPATATRTPSENRRGFRSSPARCSAFARTRARRSEHRRKSDRKIHKHRDAADRRIDVHVERARRRCKL